MAGTLRRKPRDAYIEEMHARIDELAEDIDWIEAKARGARAELRADWNQRLATLRARRDNARARLHALKAGSEAAWEHMKASVDDAWALLQAAVKDARDKT